MILLTGGSGYIGSAILKHLRGHRREVDAPPTHHLNAQNPTQIEEYLRTREYEAMVLAHGNYGAIGTLKGSHPEYWRRAIEQHVFGVVDMIYHARCSGPIIVFGGARGGRIPLPERSSYAAAKAALNAIVITGAAEGLPIYGIAPGPQPSRHVSWLLEHSEASAETKREVGHAMDESCGVEPVLALVDRLLAGDGKPGTFYSARGL